MNFRDAVQTLKEIDIYRLMPAEAQGKTSVHCMLPGHNDSTPSFSIRAEAQSFRCFGCNSGGSTIDLYMALHGLPFVDAVRRMAEEFHVEIGDPTPEDLERLDKEERRRACLEFACWFYAERLVAPDHQEVLAYLTGRGFTPKTLQDNGIGWADKNLWNAAARSQALKDKGITHDDFVACGLRVEVKDRPGRFRDFFINRVIFPLIRGGRVVGLSGRAWGDDSPKYLNMMGPKKVANGAPLDLFNADATRHQIVWVGEGLPDTLTLMQWGLPATGSPGTGGVHQHASRFASCKKVVFCWDNDPAGEREGLKAAAMVQLAMTTGGQCYFVQLPDGVKDVNEWMQAGGTRAALEALPQVALIEKLIKAIAPDAAPEAKHDGLTKVYELLASLPEIHQDHYHELTKRHLNVRAQVSRTAVEAKAKQQVRAKSVVATNDGGYSEETIYERKTPIVPAMDFLFDGEPTAINTVYLVRRRLSMDEKSGKAVKVDSLEPFLVRVKSPMASAPDLKPVKDMGLMPAERRRVPLPQFSDRWRAEEKHPHGLKRFLRGDIQKVDPAGIYDDLVALFRRYIFLPDTRDHNLLAVWAMQSYVYRVFNALGYLWLHGVTQSGKSQIRTLLSDVCFNAVAATSLTESTLFRMTESSCITLFIDEAERLKDPKPGSTDEALVLACNDGYKRGGTAYRNALDPNTKEWTPTAFDTYGPKVFGSIHELDYVMTSRCIKVSALRATASESASLKDHAQNQHHELHVVADLRDRLHCWALLNFADLHRTYTEKLIESPVLMHLRGREREMWLPLITIADHIDRARGGVANFDDLSAKVLLDLQVSKQSARRSREQSNDLDLLIATQLRDLIDSGTIYPISYGAGVGGHWYAFPDCARVVSDALIESGSVSKEKPCSGQKLRAVLLKTGAISDDDGKRVKVGGAMKAAFLLRDGALDQAIERLGGTRAASPELGVPA